MIVREEVMSRIKRWSALVLCAALLLAPHLTLTHAKAKKPIKESDARRAIAAMPGFALNRGAVKVKEIAGDASSAVLVTAEVETAVRFKKVEAEDSQGANLETASEKWRAVEFRSGDRSWEEFEWFAAAVGPQKVEHVRGLLGEMAAEFEERERARQMSKEAARQSYAKTTVTAAAVPPLPPLSKAESKRREREAKQAAKRQAEAEEQSKSEREVRRAGVRLTEFSPLLSAAVAICFIEATFRLRRSDDGKWHVVEFTIGDVPSGDLEQIRAAVDTGKAARARAELETIRAALEAFRRERGFYVVAVDATVLVDHLSPRYLTRIIRIDPWHRPYKYEGTLDRYTLRSDGADGVAGTADDVTLGT